MDEMIDALSGIGWETSGDGFFWELEELAWVVLLQGAIEGVARGSGDFDIEASDVKPA